MSQQFTLSKPQLIALQPRKRRQLETMKHQIKASAVSHAKNEFFYLAAPMPAQYVQTHPLHERAGRAAAAGLS
jgi:hypothetical protein